MSTIIPQTTLTSTFHYHCKFGWGNKPLLASTFGSWCERSGICLILLWTLNLESQSICIHTHTRLGVNWEI